MHPALSVIFFTTASGIGFGLLVWLGALACFAVLPHGAVFGATAVLLALAFSASGLMASTLHLGRPERAWRAFSQWRTSWLSREGIAAMVTFAPAALFGLVWFLSGATGGLVCLLGLVSAGLALVTLYCTAMIYASLTTIHQWHNKWVIWNYLLLGLFSGSLWLAMLTALFGVRSVVLCVAVVVSGVAALVSKLGYWRFIDTTSSASTSGTATGLGRFGSVRLLDAPHTEDNYLLKEMGFRIARKHARRLRMISVAFTFGGPLLFSILGLALPLPGTAVTAVLAALSAAFGIFVERWLFFAEAKHTVTLYYGALRV